MDWSLNVILEDVQGTYLIFFNLQNNFINGLRSTSMLYKDKKQLTHLTLHHNPIKIATHTTILRSKAIIRISQ